jgi:hypothetical protein
MRSVRTQPVMAARRGLTNNPGYFSNVDITVDRRLQVIGSPSGITNSVGTSSRSSGSARVRNLECLAN